MLRINRVDTAARILVFIGTCGEVPVKLFRDWEGYYDYNRRLVTRLVREGFLLERKFTGCSREVVRSVHLSAAGLRKVEELSPAWGKRIREHRFAPEGGSSDWKKVLRQHRNAYALLTVRKLGARWVPRREKEAALGTQLVYFSTYELNRKYGWDNKGVRAAGILCDTWGRIFFVYYLGSHNMQWNDSVEEGFRSRVETAMDSEHYHPTANLFLGETWLLAENLARHGANPRTRLIRPVPDIHSYYSATDQHGLELLRLILNRDGVNEFFYFLRKQDLILDYMMTEFLFELGDLTRFIKRPKQRFNPRTACIFDFQQEAMERINDVGAELISLPGDLLTQFHHDHEQNSI